MIPCKILGVNTFDHEGEKSFTLNCLFADGPYLCYTHSYQIGFESSIHAGMIIMVGECITSELYKDLRDVRLCTAIDVFRFRKEINE